MRIFERVRARQARQREYFLNNSREAEQSNRRLTLPMLSISVLTYLLFLIIAALVPSYHALFVPYICEMLFLAALLLCAKPLMRHVPCAILIYAAYSSLVGFSIYTSAFVTPDFTSVIILFVLIQIPVVTLDRAWRVNTVLFVLTALYLVLAVPHKAPSLQSDEFLNCLLFSGVGAALGDFLRHTRLENMEYRRLADQRERIDALTGLFSRPCLFRRFSELEQAGTAQSGTGLFMLDIDWFKTYNDTYGHQAGDDCLRAIGLCFAEFGLRHGFTFYRYGGEEFVGITHGCDAGTLFGLAEKLGCAVEALSVAHTVNPAGVVTVSIGISLTAQPLTENECRRLLSEADIALYAAKHRGRSRAVLFEPGMEMSAKKE